MESLSTLDMSSLHCTEPRLPEEVVSEDGAEGHDGPVGRGHGGRHDAQQVPYLEVHGTYQPTCDCTYRV